MATRKGRLLASLAGIAAAIVMPATAAFADGPDASPGPVDTVVKVYDMKPLPKPVIKPAPQVQCQPSFGAFFSIPIGTDCS